MAPERHTETTSARALLRRRFRHLAAFTLAEALIASVVLAASVIGISGVLSASYQNSSGYGNTATALGLAQELMEEISSKPTVLGSGVTNQPGWPIQTDRTQYDTVDDYNGYSDISSSIKTADGSTVDAGDGNSYIRTVTVTSNAIPPAIPTGTASDFLLVTVTVQMPKSQSIQLSQLFTKTLIYR
jgi:hypothetical protein